mgnify:CR=1 FL=1
MNKLSLHSKNIIAVLSTVFFLFIAFGSLDDDENGEENARNTEIETNKLQNFNVPENQKSFENMRKSQYEKYTSSKNDIKRSNAFNDANDLSKNFYEENNGKIKDFTGQITTISTDQGGDYLHITVKSKLHGITISYKTFNNSFSDDQFNSLIKKGSDVYNKVAELEEGDYVYFSANMYKNKDRGIKEISMTERGSLSSPEFIVKFSDIRRSE